MAKVLSSISGNLISAASAGYAPTNSADVSAIASAYQVVSATGTQLYAGTAHVTSINGDPISASRAGNAANASMATSAYYDGTGRLISSLPDSATVSAIASGYATSKVDMSSISAQSAQWNSVYNTVNLNSASWSGGTGGGGDVTSPSGTIVVINGNEIEGTNSAVLTASGSEYLKTLSPYGNSIGQQLAPLTYSYVDYTGCTLSITLIQDTYQDTTAILSGHNPQGQIATASANILFGLRNIELPMGDIVSAISASANSWLNFDVYASFTARKSGGIMVTGVGELAWQSAVDNVTNTVATNSASWGQGGVDSATVSSIASSYAKSAASGKLDASAIGFGVNDGDLVASSISGRPIRAKYAVYGVNGIYLSSYALSADVSGTIDTVSSNSASWATVTGKLDSSASSSFYTTANESGFVDSSYVDSSVSGKADSSSLSSYALSADVSGTVDVVSTQSANWGGSALALSAGPGVSLTKSGNTLIAGLDETVLWSGSATAATLVEPVTNFEYIEIYATRVGTNRHAYAKCPGSATQIDAFNAYGGNLESQTGWFGISNGTFNLSGTGISAIPGYQISFFTSGNFRYQTIGNYMSIMKVVGINRTAGV